MHIRNEPDLFYLTYKDKNNVFLPLSRNSAANINGFTRNFNANEATSGGSLFVDLHFYGTRTLDVVNAWTPTASEKAPLELKFPRVSYVKNKDVSYALLLFDFSESFIKNFDENLVYYDLNNKTLLDSLKIKISVGTVNQESFNVEYGAISSDYISLNSPDDRIGILFIDKADIEIYLANNSTISEKKYLVYNYIPKSVNNQHEFIPIRLEFALATEEINKLPQKNLGNEFPVNKVEEIEQIYKLQVKEFSSLQSSETTEYSKKIIYLNNVQMPITSWEINQPIDAAYFEVENYINSIQFNTLFSYSKIYYKGFSLYDFFKYGKHIFELKADPSKKDALPKTIRFLNNWTDPESSISYAGYYEPRSLDKIFWEISGFFKHIVWLFNSENSLLSDKVILRQVYLNKLKTILLNLLFEKPASSENLIEYYKREDIYRVNYKKFYNYDQYSGDNLSDSEIFLLQMTVRNFLYLIDVLWFLNSKEQTTKIYENLKFYQYIEQYLFNNFAFYNSDKFKKLESILSSDLSNNISFVNSYLMSVYQFYYLKEYLLSNENITFGENRVSFFDFVELNRKIVAELNIYTNFLKIFSPEYPTTVSETIAGNYYWPNALCLSLFEEILNSPMSQLGIRYTSNYQFWHIIEKDFALHSRKIGDDRFIVQDSSNFDSFASTLNNIDIISTMIYGFIDSITTTSGSTISLKAKILTNI